MKPSFAIQWHITDECDQRCKHCYIFAEGGCADLASMPYDPVERATAVTGQSENDGLSMISHLWFRPQFADETIERRLN